MERAQEQPERLLEAAAMLHSDQQHSDGAAPQWSRRSEDVSSSERQSEKQQTFYSLSENVGDY